MATYQDHRQRVDAVVSQVKFFHEQKRPFRIYHGSTNSTRYGAKDRDSVVDTSKLTHVIEGSLRPLDSRSRAVDTTTGTNAELPSPSSLQSHSPDGSTSKISQNGSTTLSSPPVSTETTHTILVEPNVPMDALLANTIQRNLCPPVVPEFPGITAGGGFAGTAGESSSFKWGFLDACVLGIEVVLADGRVVWSGRNGRKAPSSESIQGNGETRYDFEDDGHLLDASAGTLGTLGVVMLLEMTLVPAKKYIEVEYHPVRSFQESVDTITMATREPGNDFVDGIQFGPDSGVVVTGRFSDGRSEFEERKEKLKIVQFTRRSDPWFYLHARNTMKKLLKSPKTEPGSKLQTYRFLTPLPSYLFRYDRGGFWVARLAYHYFHVPFDRFSRFLMDTWLHTRPMYHALHASGLSKQFVVQDVSFRPADAVEFMRYADKEWGVWPLWVCPLKRGKLGLTTRWWYDEATAAKDGGIESGPDSAKPVSADEEAKLASEQLINIGIWGAIPKRYGRDFVAPNRELEARVRDLRGTKWLYSETYYTEDEFWAIYDLESYNAVRKQYGAESLPSVWEKVRQQSKVQKGSTGHLGKVKERLKEVWPVRGAYGVIKLWVSGDYILTKDRNAIVKGTK
jgi:delta24-sterol reductase